MSCCAASCSALNVLIVWMSIATTLQTTIFFPYFIPSSFRHSCKRFVRCSTSRSTQIVCTSYSYTYGVRSTVGWPERAVIEKMEYLPALNGYASQTTKVPFVLAAWFQASDGSEMPFNHHCVAELPDNPMIIVALSENHSSGSWNS